MTLIQARDWLRRNGEEVALAAARGEPQAQAVMRYYREAYALEGTSDKRAKARAYVNLIGCLHEFIVRDLKIDSRRELTDRYGYKNDEG